MGRVPPARAPQRPGLPLAGGAPQRDLNAFWGAFKFGGGKLVLFGVRTGRARSHGARSPQCPPAGLGGAHRDGHPAEPGGRQEHPGEPVANNPAGQHAEGQRPVGKCVGPACPTPEPPRKPAAGGGEGRGGSTYPRWNFLPRSAGTWQDNRESGPYPSEDGSWGNGRPR